MDILEEILLQRLLKKISKLGPNVSRTAIKTKTIKIQKNKFLLICVNVFGFKYINL